MEETDYVCLKERLDAFVEEEVAAALVKLRPVHTQFITAGAFNGSRRLLIENETLLEHFRDSVARMAWFVFQAANGDPRAPALLESGANKLAERLAGTRGKQRDAELAGRFGSNLQAELVDQLALAVKNACTDFRFGMAGGQLLKKGSDINVTNVMHNSPGGVQAAAGVGDVSQTVTQQTYARLIGEIDGMLNSSGFKALGEEQQAELRDQAEVIRDEAKKENPDRSKVTRWGERLMNTAKQFGIQAAASGVGTVLAEFAKRAL